MKTELLLIVTLLIGIGINTSLYSNTTNRNVANETDSITVKKNNSKREVIIHANRKIKIWRNDNSKIKGVFKKLDNGILTIINNKEQEIQIPIDDIKKLKVFGSLTRTIIAGVVTGIGVISTAAAGVFLIAAITASSSFGGAIAGGIAGVGSIGGFIFLMSGALISGKKYNLKKKWTIQTDQ